MKFACTHYVNTPPEEAGQHLEYLHLPVDKTALLLVNVYGLLLPMDHTARQAQVSIYGETEVIYREELVRLRLLPVMQAARKIGMQVIYLADSAPNIGMEDTQIRELMLQHLQIDPVTHYAEDCNDPLEYHAGNAQRIAYAPELTPQENDYYVRKWVYSGFHATWLDRLLRNLKVDTLFCAGFNSDSDLLCTMLEGCHAGYRIILLRDCHAAVHIPSAEPEMGFTQRLEMYAEDCIGFTITPENFCNACNSPIQTQPELKNPTRLKEDTAPSAGLMSVVETQRQESSFCNTLSFPTRYFRRYPAGRMQGYADELVNLDLTHTAFLVVDVYGETPNPIVVNRIAPTLQAARDTGLQVVYAGNSAPRVDLDHYEFTIQRNRNAKHYFPQIAAELITDPLEYHHGDGPWGRYPDCVAPRPGDVFIRKIAYSGFYDTRLDSVLRHMKIENLIAVGFSASQCLLGTLIDAFNRNYRVILLRDCTRGGAMTQLERKTDAFTKRMVLWMETYIGVSATSDDFITSCSTLRASQTNHT